MAELNLQEIYNNCTKQQKKDIKEYADLEFKLEFFGNSNSGYKRLNELKKKLRKQKLFGLLS